MLASNNLKPIFSLFLLVLLGFDWGTGFSIARFATTNGVPPLGYSFWQSLGPAIFVACITLYRAKSLQFSLINWRFYLIASIIGIVLPNTMMYFAAPHLPTSIIAMIVNTVPIFAYPLALVTRLETYNSQRLIGVSLALCGLMLIILHHASLPSTESLPWILATLITPIGFASCSVFVAHHRPENCDSFTLASGMLAFSSLLLIPIVFWQKSFYPLHLPLNAADKIIILEIILSSIGYILYFQLIKIAGAVYFSMVDTIVVLTGLFWGRIIFNEHLNLTMEIAVGFILLALFLVTKKQSETNVAKKISYAQ